MILTHRRKAQWPMVKRTYASGFAQTPSHLLTQFTWKAMLYEQDGSVRLVVRSITMEDRGLEQLSQEAIPNTTALRGSLAHGKMVQVQMCTGSPAPVLSKAEDYETPSPLKVVCGTVLQGNFQSNTPTLGFSF